MKLSSFARQKIFESGLPVETISLYLLCQGLHEAERTISTKNLLGIWNASISELAENLDFLCGKNILKKILSDLESEKNAVYRLTVDANKWKI